MSGRRLLDSDVQHAAAMLQHYLRNDVDAFHLVLTEASDEKRAVELVIALCEVFDNALRMLPDDEVLTWLSQVSLTFADGESDVELQQHIRRPDEDET